jgi:hypothetical protein
MVYIATAIFESSLRNFRDSLNINIGEKAIYIKHIDNRLRNFLNRRRDLVIRVYYLDL